MDEKIQNPGMDESDFDAWAKSIEIPTSGALLVVDDEVNIAKIEATMLQAAGYKVYTAHDGEQALELCALHQPDVVLLDFMMPRMDGLEVLGRIQERFPNIYVIVVTGKGSEEKAVEFMRAGASDYITKPLPKPQILRQIVERTLRLREAELKSKFYTQHLRKLTATQERKLRQKTEELERQNAMLQEMVTRDDLTGLFNQKALYTKLEEEIARAQRYQRELGFIMLDLDHFKQVNDQHGHLAGSGTLKLVAQVIQKSIRTVDWAARFGGDEFCVALPETDAAGTMVAAERIRRNIENYPFHPSPLVLLRVKASLGAAVLQPGINGAGLIKLADDALYRAKAGGRNQVNSSF